jgi:hypothetical protein
MPVHSLQGADWVSTGDPTTVNESTPFALGQLGTVIFAKNSTLFSPGLAPRAYQYVKLKAAATAGVGFKVIWDDYDNFVVTTVGTGTIANCGKFAGVTPSASLAAGNYGFIQVGGQAPALINAATTPAIGDHLIPDATDTEFGALLPALGTPMPHTIRFEGIVLSLKNAGSIGTHVVEALIDPYRHGW